jgi:hypothetical protein
MTNNTANELEVRVTDLEIINMSYMSYELWKNFFLNRTVEVFIERSKYDFANLLISGGRYYPVKKDNSLIDDVSNFE